MVSRYWKGALWFLALVFLFSCAGPPPKKYVRNGKVYGLVEGAFRHRWWNYYERALSFIEGEFYAEALADLNEALKQRREDQRFARTYGMHFIDYFPHREKGLAYYLMGDYQRAKIEFDLSMDQEPNAKAKYYLDRIRKIMLEQQQPEISIPRLWVDLPSKEVWTRQDPVAVSGRAEDEQYVSQVNINGKQLYQEVSQKSLAFKEELDLDQGRHVIRLEAVNLLGGRAEREFVIHVDRQGPVINVEPPPSSGAGEQIVLQGYLFDDSGEVSLVIDGAPHPVPKGKEVRFEVPVDARSREVHLTATDRLGNETSATIDIHSLMTGHRGPLLALADHGAVVSDAGPLQLAFSFGKKDQRKPTIKLKGWSEEQTVFLEKIYLEGQARDENDIVDLTINGVPVLRREGRMIFFNHLVALKEGKNPIKIEVTDESGNKTVKKIDVIREVPKVFQIDSRFSISLMPFENKGMTTGLGDMFYNQFYVHVMDRNRFRVIEREKLDMILQEQNLSQTKLVDQDTALKIGNLAAAQATCIGNFIETRIGIEVVARLVDNETSEVLAVEDVYDEFKDRATLVDLSEGLAVKFHREFPLVDGIVVQTDGKSLVTDLGKSKIKPQRRILIYREGEPIKHPITGKILGCDTQLIGYARVNQVMENMSKVKLLESLDGAEVGVKDKVMTQ